MLECNSGQGIPRYWGETVGEAANGAEITKHERRFGTENRGCLPVHLTADGEKGGKAGRHTAYRRQISEASLLGVVADPSDFVAPPQDRMLVDLISELSGKLKEPKRSLKDVCQQLFRV